MNASLTRKTATKRYFLVVAAATAVILCGCSQEISTHSSKSGPARWIKVDNEVVTETTPAIQVALRDFPEEVAIAFNCIMEHTYLLKTPFYIILTIPIWSLLH